MPDVTKIKLSQKSAVAILLAFVVFALIFLTLDKNGVWHQKTIKFSQNNTQSVDYVKMKSDYLSGLKFILSNYLSEAATANLTSADFIDKTKKSSLNVLALTLPAEYKDTHLSVVLDLSAIEKAASDGKIDVIKLKLKDLSDLMTSLR